MEIILDLLPEDRKEKIRKERIFKKVLSQELRFLLPILFVSATLFVINYSLKMQLQVQEKYYSEGNSQQAFKDLKVYEKKFSEINKLVEKTAAMEAGHLRWSNVFLEISRIFPDTIQASSLVTKDYSATLSGKAKTRDELISFQQKMQSSECFENVEVPLSNLVSREDVTFQMDFDIKPECLKKKL